MLGFLLAALLRAALSGPIVLLLLTRLLPAALLSRILLPRLLILLALLLIALALLGILVRIRHIPVCTENLCVYRKFHPF